MRRALIGGMGLSFLVALGVVGCGADTAPPDGAPAMAWKLSLWQGGLLRGANAGLVLVTTPDEHDLFGPGPVGPPYAQADLDRLAALGANLVVLSHPGVNGSAKPYPFLPAVEAHLDGLLARAEKADLFAVIAFRTGPGRNEALLSGVGTPDEHVWRDAVAQDAWVAMWRHVAGRYAGRKVVAGYELLVEATGTVAAAADHPNDGAAADPAAFLNHYGGTTYDYNPMAARMIAAIREVDGSTPILLGANNYSSIAWLPTIQLSADAGVVLDVHQYEPEKFTHCEADQSVVYPGVVPEDKGPVQADRAWLNGLLGALVPYQKSHPVSVSEYGAQRFCKGAPAYLGDEHAIFSSFSLSHAVWLWESSFPGINYDQFNYRRGENPAVHVDGPSATLDALSADWKPNRERPSQH